jgi:site-specific DNA recombinase
MSNVMTDKTHSMRVAIYARVSSEQQAQEQTIASQVAALRERVAAEGSSLDEELCFIDDGISGTTLQRPALERLRDQSWQGIGTIITNIPEDRARRNRSFDRTFSDSMSKWGDCSLM